MFTCAVAFSHAAGLLLEQQVEVGVFGSGSRQSVGVRGEVCGRMAVTEGDLEAVNSDPSVRRMKS